MNGIIRMARIHISCAMVDLVRNSSMGMILRIQPISVKRILVLSLTLIAVVLGISTSNAQGANVTYECEDLGSTETVIRVEELICGDLVDCPVDRATSDICDLTERCIVEPATGPEGNFARCESLFVQPLNAVLELRNSQVEYDPADPRAPSGVFTIDATFSNSTAVNFVDVFFKVVTLNRGNRVLNATTGGRAGSRVNGLSEVESGGTFDVVFEIGLQDRGQFEFFVDAFGEEVSGGPKGVPVQYTSFENDTLNLYAWEGENIALLTQTDELDPDTMKLL